ncbi:MAG: N-acetyltransferase [Actinomycetes bacterium]|jgi:putative acetyltransferase|nr:N-acetyltransferase [Actinomycetes bacterium]
MEIREEGGADYRAIWQLVQEAFDAAPISTGSEQEYIDMLRGSARYLPELSLVAVDRGRLLGHIMLTRSVVVPDSGQTAPGTAADVGADDSGESDVCTSASTMECLVLGPVAVDRRHQGQGIGSALIREGLHRARRLGYRLVFLTGDRDYYGRFGFVPAADYGIYCQPDLPAQYRDRVLVLELVPGAVRGVAGTVQL